MDENMKAILQMCTKSLEVCRDDYDMRIRRCRYLIDSAEAKLKRIDPISEEFDETIQLIEDTQKELDTLFYERILVHHEICNREFATIVSKKV